MIGSVIHLCMTVLVVATMLASAGVSSPTRAAACMDNRAVQALIAAHQIKTWPAIKALAGISDKYKEVSAVRVCEQGGAPYYVVNVAGPSGESKQLVLNAVDGSD